MTKHCDHCGQRIPEIAASDIAVLRLRRRGCKWSLDQLAAQIGVSKVALWNWENGVRQPNVPHYAAWRAALGME